MEWYVILLIALAAVLAAFIGVIAVRTAMFKPKKTARAAEDKLTCDEKKAVSDLQAMIRCKTVSDTDESKEDEAEFEKFEKLLPELFPEIHKACAFEKPGRRSLLFCWKGKDSSKCRVLMAHYDVVSVEQSLWSKPAFDGVLENGVLWGRGTLDTKGTLNGVLQAAEQLIKEGFVPQNDVYMAFSGNEETNGDGAPAIVRYFQSKNIRPALVCDEGGAVVENVFPGVKEPCALIGVAEKGLLNVRFSVAGNGGHASSPPPHTAVGKLSRACARVENNPFKGRLSKPVAEMFDTLGRRSTLLYRMIFANLWCFKGLLDKICKKTGGELNALMRTTCAFTQMSGSKGMNVLPPYAEMIANLRIMCGETTDRAIAYLKETVADDGVKVEKVYGMNPSNISATEGEAWNIMCNAVSGTWKDAVVSPYLMLACSDSRHYGAISDYVYRFSAMPLTKEERATIHGNDERIPTEKIAETVKFYLRLIKQC
ncbi:MAG: peptidase M20 [Bacillota bacterium]|nr:MAG: peptidase M20 [Bacillota bacterium]